jgi:hypothetical protein
MRTRQDLQGAGEIEASDTTEYEEPGTELATLSRDVRFRFRFGANSVSGRE